MKIIFLEFDNVLNSECYYLKRNRNMRELRLIEINPKNESERLVQWHMYNLDLDNIEILRDIVEQTGAQIVVTSNWKNLKCFKGICKELIKLGLPIIDVTKDENNTKGSGIKKYLAEHEVEEYAIFDDQIADDYDDELIAHLVISGLNLSGLREKESEKAMKLLKKK